MNGRRVVFLDKDGTLIDNEPYNVDPRRVRLAKGAGPGCRWLHQAGYELIVVTNQSGVAMKRFPEQALVLVEQRVRDLLSSHHVTLSGFFYCPHHPQGLDSKYTQPCECRKPSSGLLLKASAAGHTRIDFQSSWLIGDTLDDIEAGSRLGCRTILIDNGGETLWQSGPFREPTSVVATFADAAATILTDDDGAIYTQTREEVSR